MMIKKKVVGLIQVTALCMTFFGVNAYAGKAVSVQSAATITPLLELYTSEGCSSCPRADEWLGKLGAALNEDFHALPLAFHVDYWNRLGWIDPFSNPGFTRRQEGIAMNNQQQTLFTPQFVVSGRGAKGSNDMIERVYFNNAQASRLSIDLGVEAGESDGIQANVLINNMVGKGSATLYFAVFENDLVNEIPAGENKGRTLHHDFVVRYWSEPYGLNLQESQSHKSINILLGSDWQEQNLGVAAVVIDDENGKTLQSVSTSIEALFES
ncbi:MAG: DUF1223 domain-containing protein [Gammaproteobacteria bacterium]|nr:DUF1223 domain-containing protein [Gammaproteobacteria bacterium]